jgi:hypothetical protein
MSRAQPKRQAGDGRIGVEAVGDGWVITAEQDGRTTTLRVSTFNLWRVFGVVALTLGVKLPDRVARGIEP